jgi:triacylglycerol lipase
MHLQGVVDGIVQGVVRGAARAFDVHGPSELGAPLAAPPRHPDPVVLLNGIACDDEMWDAFAASLRRDGFTVQVVALPRKALGDIRATAEYVSAEVDRLRARTGARKVDVVGYSEGGLIARELVRHHGGEARIESLVTLGTPHNGFGPRAFDTWTRHLPLAQAVLPTALQQMFDGSEFLTALNAGDPTPGRVRYTSIMSRGWDGIVWPGTSPVLEGADNVVLDAEPGFPPLTGPHHLQLTQRSDAAYEAVRAALLA